MTTKTPILYGGYYHLYNHSNGGLKLFRSDENYRYFIERYKKYVSPITDTLAYCLMPNHFHFLVRIKDYNEILSKLSNKSEIEHPFYLTNAIKNWLISYTQAYNKAYNVRGNLYHQKIRRKEINNDQYLLSLVAYINLNPIHHHFAVNPEEWRFSSYNALTSNKNTLVNRKFVIDLFGGMDNFKFYHDVRRLEYLIDNLKIEY